MKARILYLITLYASLIGFFVLQKIIFILCNTPLSPGDTLQVIVHGLGLDASTTGYLVAIPFILVWLSIWLNKLHLRTILRPFFILIALLLSLICVADTSLYSFWNFKLDATIFNYIDSPKQAMASVSYGYLLMRTVLFLLFSTPLAWWLIRITPQKLPVLPINKRSILHNLTMVLCGGLIFLAIRGGIGRSTMNIGDAYFSSNNYMNHAAVNPAFSLMYSWNKAEDFGGKYNYLDENQRQNVRASLYTPTPTTPTRSLLKTRRPNILIILLEGFGGNYIAELDGAPHAAPNISRLIKEGVFFDRVYANSFRTDRGLVSALSGHVSYPTNSIMKLPAKVRFLPGIANTLKEHGYETEFLYGGDINFTNMRSYFTTIGYDKLTSDKDFTLKERTSSSWGAHDEYAFNRLLEMIASHKGDKLWHTGFLTLSSHEPFEVPYHRLEDKRENAFAYTDHCLGMFIDRLKALPAWDNLLVICLPDHGSSPTFNTTSPSFYHIPMLWLGGAIKQPETIHTLMNQSDMPATLLGQMGISHENYEYSRDVLSPDYTYPFAYSTFNDGFLFQDSTGVTVFDNTSGTALYSHPTPSVQREEKGKAILQTSYDELEEK